jgi:RNA polymerase primary sigma factor
LRMKVIMGRRVPVASPDEGYYQLLRAILPDVELEVADQGLLKRSLDALISELAPADQDVVKLRFGLLNGAWETLQRIGDKMGVTRERVRQLERRALRRLKHPARRGKLAEFVLTREDADEQ